MNAAIWIIDANTYLSFSFNSDILNTYTQVNY